MPRSKKQQLVDGKRHAIYKKLMGEAEKAYYGRIKSLGDYWWSLFLIKHDKLWGDGDGYGSEREWVASLAKEPWGPSYQAFYDKHKAFRQWQDAGIDGEKELKLMLGDGKTATTQDQDQLFDKKRVGGETTYEVKPEIAEELEERGETVADLIRRAQGLGPGEARKEIRRYYEKDHIYFVGPLEMSGSGGPIMVRVRWENEDDGLMFEGTIAMTLSQNLPEERDNVVFPGEIFRTIAGRLGVDF